MSMEVSKAAGAKSPVSFPSRAFKGQLRAKRHIAVQYVAPAADWRRDERHTALFGRLYIHSHAGYTPTSTPSPHRHDFPLVFFRCPVYGGVDRGEHTISRCPNKENWITPGLTSPEATPRLSVPSAVEETV